MENKIIISKFIANAFQLKTHLAQFLSIDEIGLDKFLENAKLELANLHPGDNLVDCADFYKEIVGDRHLADLAAWHISSKDYIADTLKLQQKFSKNLVLDFGGGIGTHAIANALSDDVTSPDLITVIPSPPIADLGPDTTIYDIHIADRSTPCTRSTISIRACKFE